MLLFVDWTESQALHDFLLLCQQTFNTSTCTWDMQLTRQVYTTSAMGECTEISLHVFNNRRVLPDAVSACATESQDMVVGQI